MLMNYMVYYILVPIIGFGFYSYAPIWGESFKIFYIIFFTLLAAVVGVMLYRDYKKEDYL